MDGASRGSGAVGVEILEGPTRAPWEGGGGKGLVGMQKRNSAKIQ